MTPSQINLVQSSSATKPAANEAGNRLDQIHINLIGGLAALCLATSPLHAGELSTMAGTSVDLGRLHGVVYYTSENDGYQVVVTMADGEAGLPVRFSTTLTENQSATISAPGNLGEPGRSLEISRSGDKLTLTEVGDVPPGN